MSGRLKSPYPYFGGKGRVATLIWNRLGDVSNYIEPFFGSGAVLLGRPHPPRIETVNDVNHFIANFWRAIKHDPEAVAEFADHAVVEVDLHSRHRWLVLSDAAAEFRRRMREDPDHYDAKVAGYWCWGACCWIGSGWCDTPESAEWSQTPLSASGWTGVHASLPDKRPLLAGPADEHGERSHYGLGVHAKGLSEQRPGISHTHRNTIHTLNVPSDAHRPQLADAYARGRGVHGNDAAGTCAARRAWLVDWFGRLRDRLRTVRVCCGHWRRVCDSPSVTTRLGTTGVYLDPPYPTHAADGTESRAGGLYASDGDRDALDALRDEVLAWCRERGPDPEMRVIVSGYSGDGYESLESEGWDVIAWRSSGGYGNRSEKGKANAERERLWISPSCVRKEEDMPLFPAGGGER